MTACFSNKTIEAGRQAREEQSLKQRTSLRQERNRLIGLLRKHGWKVTIRRDHDAQELGDDTLQLDVHYEVKPPGAASVIRRGVDSLATLAKGLS